MAYLEQKLQPRLSQRLIITPALQQAIRLLQLSKLDLQEEISIELEKNPALEEAGTVTEEGSAKSDAAPADREVTAGDGADRADDDFDYASFFRDLEDSYRPTQGMTERIPREDLPSFEQVLSADRQLSDHLQWQLEMSALTGAHRRIGEAIIGNLDARGYLEASIDEVVALAPESEDWSVDEVEAMRQIIQRFDPVGVASVDLTDCLLVQLEMQGMSDTPAARAIREHLDLLEQQRHEDLAEELSLDEAEFAETLDIIRHLDPRPGEKYGGERATYITPDVYVIKDGDEYRVLLNDDGLPRLRVSPSYRRLLEAAASNGSDANTKEFLRDKVRSAVRLIRSLEERQRTINKVANSIVKFQRAFLEKGIEAIRPLVLRDVAEDIGMHESTVSRVVNSKYMHTPRGLFEMRFFFHSGLPGGDGDSVSSLMVKERIKKLVEEEDSVKPLSDQAIVKALAAEEIKIARRTVAKYREELRIPSSTRRRRGRGGKRK